MWKKGFFCFGKWSNAKNSRGFTEDFIYPEGAAMSKKWPHPERCFPTWASHLTPQASSWAAFPAWRSHPFILFSLIRPPWVHYNLIHPLRHSEERILRRENPIFLNILKNKNLEKIRYFWLLFLILFTCQCS